MLRKITLLIVGLIAATSLSGCAGSTLATKASESASASPVQDAKNAVVTPPSREEQLAKWVNGPAQDLLTDYSTHMDRASVLGSSGDYAGMIDEGDKILADVARLRQHSPPRGYPALYEAWTRMLNKSESGTRNMQLGTTSMNMDTIQKATEQIGEANQAINDCGRELQKITGSNSL